MPSQRRVTLSPGGNRNRQTEPRGLPTPTYALNHICTHGVPTLVQTLPPEPPGPTLVQTLPPEPPGPTLVQTLPPEPQAPRLSRPSLLNPRPSLAWCPHASPPAAFLSPNRQPLFSKSFFTAKSKHLQVYTTKKKEGQEEEGEDRKRRRNNNRVLSAPRAIFHLISPRL